MAASISDGVWPTMVTPFTADDKIDFDALAAQVEWYLARGVDGLFAVCQSSEMFYLSLDERVALARAVVERVAGRVEVIASGHISDDSGRPGRRGSAHRGYRRERRGAGHQPLRRPG